MISALITFLSSSAGGALFRLVLQMLSKKEASEQDKRKHQFEDQLSQRKQLVNYAKAINAPQVLKPVRISKHVKRTFPLLGSYEYKKQKEVFPRSVRGTANNLILGLLACSYCFVMLLFAAFPDVAITTFNPTEEPTKVNLLIISWEYSRKNPVTLTTGGVAYMMAHPLVFILTAWLTGLPFKNR